MHHSHCVINSQHVIYSIFPFSIPTNFFMILHDFVHSRGPSNVPRPPNDWQKWGRALHKPYLAIPCSNSSIKPYTYNIITIARAVNLEVVYISNVWKYRRHKKNTRIHLDKRKVVKKYTENLMNLDEGVYHFSHLYDQLKYWIFQQRTYIHVLLVTRDQFWFIIPPYKLNSKLTLNSYHIICYCYIYPSLTLILTVNLTILT